jgi:hypothetical protein
MMNQIECVSRRAAVQRGLGLIATVVVFAGASRTVLAADSKLARAVVQYTDNGTVKGKDCDDCIQYIPGALAAGMGTCKIVVGDISPHGHCIAFSPKPKS